jgi:hypothetical protein
LVSEQGTKSDYIPFIFKFKHESDKYKEGKKPPLEDCSDIEYLINDNFLVIRRSLNV